jgi:hypothetical protein
MRIKLPEDRRSRDRSRSEVASPHTPPHRWPRLSSDSLLILGGTALYHPAATLQVERCALSVAGSHTLPVSMVINDPHLLAIYP